MRERPILFSPPMVDAVWNLRKTQTRRVMPQVKHTNWTGYMLSADKNTAIECGPDYPDDKADRIRNPYGIPGDRLWIREGWAADHRFDHLRPSQIPKGSTLYYKQHSEFLYSRETHKVRSARFMCRWMSRIMLEITDVRVQRVQDISEDDAQAEGVEPLDSEREVHDWKICPTCGGTRLYTYCSMAGACPDTDCVDCDTNKKRFHHVWTAINGKTHPWASNPWVWAITFRRIA